MANKTCFVLLGLLNEEELTGYEMKKIINERMSFFWQESYGQIYPQLKSLLEEGCIEKAHIEDLEKSGRGKIKYKITDKGRNKVKKWMKEDNEKESIRSEMLLKMYLSTEDDKDEMKRHLEKFYKRTKAQIDEFKEFEEKIKRIVEVKGIRRQTLDVLSLGMRQAEASNQWSKEMIERIEKEENNN